MALRGTHRVFRQNICDSGSRSRWIKERQADIYVLEPGFQSWNREPLDIVVSRVLCSRMKKSPRLSTQLDAIWCMEQKLRGFPKVTLYAVSLLYTL